MVMEARAAAAGGAATPGIEMAAVVGALPLNSVFVGGAVAIKGVAGTFDWAVVMGRDAPPATQTSNTVAATSAGALPGGRPRGLGRAGGDAPSGSAGGGAADMVEAGVKGEGAVASAVETAAAVGRPAG